MGVRERERGGVGGPMWGISWFLHKLSVRGRLGLMKGGIYYKMDRQNAGYSSHDSLSLSVTHKLGTRERFTLYPKYYTALGFSGV